MTTLCHELTQVDPRVGVRSWVVLLLEVNYQDREQLAQSLLFRGSFVEPLDEFDGGVESLN